MKKFILNSRRLHIFLYNTIKWHFDYYIRKKSFPLIAGIFTTSRCNMRCLMCTIWRNKIKEDISLEEFKEFINSITPGLSYLSFSGGEPLLLPDIYEMINYANKKVPYLHLVTNGMLMTPEIAKKLQKNGLNEISISIDGNKEFHERIRGIKGSYEKAVSAIETIIKYAPKLKIVINTVLFPNFPEQVYNVLKLVEKYNVYMKIQAVNKHFNFSEMLEGRKFNIKLDKAEKNEIEILIKKLKKSKRVLNSNYYLNHIIEYFWGRLKFSPSYPKCILPHFFVELNGNGILSPCMYGTGWEEGINWRKTTIKKVLQSPEFYYIKKELEKCKKCDKSMYICYWEPLSIFPIHNFIKYTLFYF